MEKTSTIGFLGRFTKEKGAHILLEAVKTLKNENLNIKLVLAGDGELKGEYLKLINEYKISENVVFLGWISDKKSFFNAIDIFCQPSLNEGFGISLLEAMKFKKPIITTDCNGPKGIFENGLNAIIVSKNSATELAIAIKKMLLDSDLQNMLAENAYIKFCNNYTYDNFLEKLQSVFEALEISKKCNILNICYHNKLGGLENIFMEYSCALSEIGHCVSSLITKNAKFKNSLQERGQKIIKNNFLRNKFLGFLFYLNLKKIIKNNKIDLIICHGERNLNYVKMAKGNTKIILVNHGVKTKNSKDIDYIIAVNSEISNKTIESGYSKNKISVIGNFLHN